MTKITKDVSSYQNTYAPTCGCLPIHGPLLEDAETGHGGHLGMQGQSGEGGTGSLAGQCTPHTVNLCALFAFLKPGTCIILNRKIRGIHI